MSRAHFAAPWPRIAPSKAAPIAASAARAASTLEVSRSAGLDRLEEQVHDHRHRRQRLAVVGVGIALAEADEPRQEARPKLHDHRRHRGPGAVRVAGDPERVAIRDLEDPGPEVPAGIHRSPPVHGSASTAALISSQNGAAPKRTGSAAGRPVSAAIAATTRRASSSSAQSGRVDGDGHDLRRARPVPAIRSCRSMKGRSGAIGNERSGRWSKSCAGQAGLVDQDHRVGRRAVDQAQGDGAVGGMVEAPLPLHDHPVAEALALLDEPLDRAVEEVADHPIDGDAPAVDHHPGLPGGNEGDGVPGGAGGVAQLQGDRHLADRAVRADRQDHPLAGAVAPADGGLEALRRAPVVDDVDAGDRRGRRQLRVVAEEGVEARVELQAGVDRRRGGSVATRPGAGRRSGRSR